MLLGDTLQKAYRLFPDKQAIVCGGRRWTYGEFYGRISRFVRFLQESGIREGDRVGILARGRLIALDSPLNLRQQHTERKVDVMLSDGERLVFDLDRDDERGRLAELTRVGRIGSVHTREFDFHSTFLKLTGTEFD